MKTYGIHLSLTSALLALLLPLSAAAQGPLSPPPGPPAPTMKTLDQVEPRRPISALPFTISEPGSYYLTRNLTGGEGDGIRIACSDVTLDLMGFELAGGSGSGIYAEQPLSRIEVRNGIIRNWGSTGVDLFASTGCVAENLRVSNNGGVGLSIGQAGLVKGCIASGNDGIGVYARGGTQITDSVASQNNYIGFYLSDGGVVRDCVAVENDDVGIRTLPGSTVRNCLSRNNRHDGILVEGSCLVVGNHCDSNGAGSHDAAGVHAVGTANHIEANNVTNNDKGIEVDDSSNLIIRNTARGNAGGGNYNIAAGNRVGSIVVPPVSGAITGNGPGPGSGMTDPVANIAY